ncbi:MAG: disulfide bond formation protein DsbB [Parcubacteria group bacterium]|nr:disulfide bond formation protein DsbB [Parcubacteria group bacterium]
MIATIQSLLPWLVLVSHCILAFLIAAFVFRRSWGREAIGWVRKHVLGLGLLVSLLAVGGSLFYSNVVGFVPCDLCWWQRIFIYPQLVLFLTALKFKDRGVFKYSWRLAVLGTIVSLYHSYVQVSGSSLLPCSATASCTKVYVMAFNYVTIPSMALTVGVYFLLLALISRTNE